MIRVLIADDEDMIRTALAALLRLEPDIEVVGECVDGEQAVAAALRLHPDVCLFDVEMPGLDGIDAAARVRKQTRSRVVAVTRHARPGVLRRALQAGVDGFLLHQYLSPGSLDDFSTLLAPRLRERGLFGGRPSEGTLRSRLRTDGADRLGADHPAGARRR